MSFDNQSNRGRVERICDLLDLIHKSAKSNRTDPDTIGDLIAPVIATIEGMGVQLNSALEDPETPITDRTTLDRAIQQRKVDRAITAVAQLAAELKALSGNVD